MNRTLFHVVGDDHFHTIRNDTSFHQGWLNLPIIRDRIQPDRSPKRGAKRGVVHGSGSMQHAAAGLMLPLDEYRAALDDSEYRAPLEQASCRCWST